MLNGYSFDKKDLFKEYVDTFYKIKSNAIGAERVMAKLSLNSLYGVFGRKKETTSVIIVNAKDLPIYLTKYIITSIIEIQPDIFTIIIQNNLNNKLLTELNTSFSSDFKYGSDYSLVKNNVAIAAAITAYARIHMMPFKLDPSCAYSDTDSVFTKDSLNLITLGKDLGLFKDELKGSTIEEAIFLGIKQYGYYYLDAYGNRKESSVFAGVKRNSLTFADILKLYRGETLTTDTRIRFYKSISNLNIKIKNIKTNIHSTPSKKLVNNRYLPVNINKGGVKGLK